MNRRSQDSSAPPGLTLIVLLYLEPGKRQQFDAFEAAASRIMTRYGGRIEERIAISPTGADDRPDEIHFVRFPDEEAFSSYRTDPELARLGELRKVALRQTVVWRGEHLPLWIDSL